MSSEKVVEPGILVVFGITGDLAKRYILPSLYHLVKYDMLDDHTEIIGLTRGDMQLDDLLASIELCVSEVDGICDPAAVQKLKKRLTLRHMDVADDAAYQQLKQHLDSVEAEHGLPMNRLFYLSVPPAAAGQIIEKLGQNGLHGVAQSGSAQTRLLAEKPFGGNLADAEDLIKRTAQYFSEEQIFRIDHYLAKETVQNFLTFRFSNPIFEPLWNKHYIEYIEVIANERLDIEGRVAFYEQTGAVRDLIQSHLLQILALIIMEQPDELTSDLIHNKKLAALKLLSQADPHTDAVRGQYVGYKDEVSNPDSRIETFAAFRFTSSDERWHDVPLIVSSGKALEHKVSEVNVVFKPTKNSPHHDVLSFRIFPKEGIELSLRVKKPGFDDEVQHVEMNFNYKTAFEGVEFKPTAYERVLVDAFRGDHTLFATADEIRESWRVVTPAVEAWTRSSDGLIEYEKGSKGPDVSVLYP